MQNVHVVSRPEFHVLSNGALVTAVSLILCAGNGVNTSRKLCLHSISISSSQDSSYRKTKCTIRKSLKFCSRNSMDILHQVLCICTCFLPFEGNGNTYIGTGTHLVCLPHIQKKRAVTYELLTYPEQATKGLSGLVAPLSEARSFALRYDFPSNTKRQSQEHSVFSVWINSVIIFSWSSAEKSISFQKISSQTESTYVHTQHLIPLYNMLLLLCLCIHIIYEWVLWSPMLFKSRNSIQIKTIAKCPYSFQTKISCSFQWWTCLCIKSLILCTTGKWRKHFTEAGLAFSLHFYQLGLSLQEKQVHHSKER